MVTILIPMGAARCPWETSTAPIMSQYLKPWRITANVPAVLKPHVLRRVISEEYDGDAQYLLALILQDLICQWPHRIMPQLLQKPRRIVDAFVESLLEHPLGVVDQRELGGWLHAVAVRTAIELISKAASAANR